jgi:hypothetical protein
MEKYLYYVEFDSLFSSTLKKFLSFYSDYCQQASNRHDDSPILYDEGSLISGVQLNEQAQQCSVELFLFTLI